MKVTRYLALFFTLFALVAIPVTVFLTTSGKDNNIRSQAADIKEVTVYLSPEEIVSTVGQQIDLDLKIDTGQETLTNFYIKAEYAPNLFRIISTSEDNSFENVRSEVNENSVIFTGQGNFIGSASIGSIKIVPLKKGSNTFSITESTLAGKNSRTKLKANNYAATITVQ